MARSARRMRSSGVSASERTRLTAVRASVDEYPRAISASTASETESAAAGAWRALGRVLRLKGELPEAKEALEKAMSLSARLPAVTVGFRIDYALVLDAQGETNRVREILAELRPVPPVLDRQTARDLAGLEAKYPAPDTLPPHAKSDKSAKKGNAQ